jgi:Tfp pilus assembly major pilin PilA
LNDSFSEEDNTMIPNNDKSLPSQILVSHSLFERRKELDQLTSAYSSIKNEKKVKKVGGKMKRPIGRVHYRTRSHKSYKIPRKQVSSKRKLSKRTTDIGDNAQKKKKKYRKQLRRVSTLIFDNHKMPIKLATHRWHAKRMEMTSFYGYSLALRSRQRGVKSVERIIKNKAALHDSSYYRPVKISCSHSQLMVFLDNHSVSASSISFFRFSIELVGFQFVYV